MKIQNPCSLALQLFRHKTLGDNVNLKHIRLSAAGVILSFILLSLSVYAWFAMPAPATTTNQTFDNKTVNVFVERYDDTAGTYSPVPLTNNVFAVTSSPFVFFMLDDNQLLAPITGNAYFRVTVTSNFETASFDTMPVAYISPSFVTTTTEPGLANLRIIKTECAVFTSVQPEFPSSGFVTANSDTTFTPVETINISGKNYFQSVIYLKLIPDTQPVQSALGSLLITKPSYHLTSENIFAFGFRSTPFHTEP